MKFVKVYGEPGKYSSFPSVVAAKGKLFACFRVAGKWSAQAALTGSPTHHDRDSACFLSVSADGGGNWSKAKKIIQASGGLNDPAIASLADGTLLVRASQLDVRASKDRLLLKGKFLSHRVDLKTVSASLGNVVVKSRDGGKTWQGPKKMDLGDLHYSFSREPVVELDDGVLVCSVYESDPFRTERAWLVRSWDKGMSWGDPAPIAWDPRGDHSAFRGTNFNETAILPLGRNRLMAMVRADESYYTEGSYMTVGGVGELLVAFSDNAGLSWSEPRATGLWGQPAHLLRLSDGKILCTYGFRKQPYGVKASISADEGKTWSKPIVLKENAPIWDIGYPSSAQTESGEVVTLYYWVDDEGVRYIEAAIWDPRKQS